MDRISSELELAARLAQESATALELVYGVLCQAVAFQEPVAVKESARLLALETEKAARQVHQLALELVAAQIAAERMARATARLSDE